MWPSWSGYQPLNSSSPSNGNSPTATSFRKPLSFRTRHLAAAGILTGVLAVVSLRHFGHSLALDNVSLPSFFTSTEACNPYAQPGFINYDPNNPHVNRWHPYAADEEADPIDSDAPPAGDACAQPAPALAAAFMRATWAGVAPTSKSTLEAAFANEQQGPDGRPWEDVEWARNRTVLYIGDSISRYNSQYFCGMVGESLVEINWNHPWAPGQMWKNGTQEPERERHDDRLDRFGWSHIEAGDPITHIAHYCYAPGLDFLFLHLHCYGLDQEKYFEYFPSHIPPYIVEDRISSLAKHYIERVRETMGRTKKAPELIYYNSAMWDAIRFAYQDRAAEQSIGTALTPFELRPLSNTDRSARLIWYRRRVREVLTFLGNTFPDSSLYWMTTHYPIKLENLHTALPQGRPGLKLVRLFQMHEAAISAIEDTTDASPEAKRIMDRVGLGRWGLNFLGQEDHQVDDMHPTFLPGGYMWADMVLYDLRHELRKRKA